MPNELDVGLLLALILVMFVGVIFVTKRLSQKNGLSFWTMAWVLLCAPIVVLLTWIKSVFRPLP